MIKTSTTEARLDQLITEARASIAEAIAEHITGEANRWGKPFRLAAIAVLYSGGNDSTVLAHLFRNVAHTAIHVNTGTGIRQTRVFVRETCAAWSLPLMEVQPPAGSDFRTLVLERGFPGPGQHFKMYQRLKERALSLAKVMLTERKYSDRVIFLAGRRRDESARRKTRADAGQLVAVERKKATIWVSPLLNWTALDLNAYRRRFPDCPRNPVADHLHMSGECLCGSFAKPGELDHVGFFYPEKKAEMEALGAEALATGRIPEQRCTWGWGASRTRKGDARKRSKSGEMCSSCEASL